MAPKPTPLRPAADMFEDASLPPWTYQAPPLAPTTPPTTSAGQPAGQSAYDGLHLVMPGSAPTAAAPDAARPVPYDNPGTTSIAEKAAHTQPPAVHSPLDTSLLSQLVNLGVIDAKGNIIDQQLAQANALRKSQTPAAPGVLGGVFSGLTNAINNTVGGYQQRQLHDQQQDLLKQQVAGRAAYGKAQGWDDDAVLTAAMRQSAQANALQQPPSGSPAARTPGQSPFGLDYSGLQF